jgi:UDP-N-acetylglucosamine 2-epimerase
MFHPDTTDINVSIYWLEQIRTLISQTEINWFWFWPNPDHGSGTIAKYVRQLREDASTRRARFIINLSPEKFLTLAKSTQVMVGNSSFGIREASFMAIKTLNLGSRQNGRQRAENVIDLSVGDNLFERFKVIVGHERPTASGLYGDGFAGKRAAEIISSWSPTLKSRSHLGI